MLTHINRCNSFGYTFSIFNMNFFCVFTGYVDWIIMWNRDANTSGMEN